MLCRVVFSSPIHLGDQKFGRAWSLCCLLLLLTCVWVGFFSNQWASNRLNVFTLGLPFTRLLPSGKPNCCIGKAQIMAGFSDSFIATSSCIGTAQGPEALLRLDQKRTSKYGERTIANRRSWIVESPHAKNRIARLQAIEPSAHLAHEWAKSQKKKAILI